jgi:DNA-binding NarL/FixJ family response regulator
MPITTPVRVVLADDHALIRAGLRDALSGVPGLSIVGEAGDGTVLLALLAEHTPDLIVLDVTMPAFDPLSDVGRIRATYPDMKIVVVTAYDDTEYVVGLLGAGVHGYHLKDQPLSDLQMAVQRVLAGERWISSPLLDRLVDQRAGAPPASRPPPRHGAGYPPALTRRQREMLWMLTQGHDNRSISHAMDLSVKTVENHLTSLYRALDVQSRLEAVHIALQHPQLLAVPGFEPHVTLHHGEGSPVILVVDDNARFRQQLTRTIARTRPDVAVYEAEDIGTAVRLAERIRPQLAFVDVVLQDEDGIECTRRLKDVSAAMRVVLVSAYPDREFRRLAMDAGAVAFLDKKDLDTAAIRQVVEDVVGAVE